MVAPFFFYGHDSRNAMIFRKLRTFWNLDPLHRHLALEAMWLSPFIRVCFALLGVPRTRVLLARPAGRRSPLGSEPALIKAARRMQNASERNSGSGKTCLIRSLALQTILARRGVETDLRIGVRNKDGVMEGHAWLEHLGSPVNESPEVVATYKLFDHPMK